MDNWRDMLGKAQQMMEEVKAIQANEESTAEDLQKILPMLEEITQIKAKAGQLRQVEMTAAELNAFADEVADDIEEKQEKQVKAGTLAPAGSEFKGNQWHQFLQAAWFAMHPNPQMRHWDDRLRMHKEIITRREGAEGKQLVENVGASGGFLVPTEFLADMQSVMAETAIVRPRATIIRMRRRSIQIPVLDQTGTTSSRPHWFGGMVFYWAEEASAKTITNATFRQVDLTAHKLIGYTRASDELLDDSAISLSDFLAGPVGMAGGISWNEDYTFINGTGAGQPLGVIPAPATITVNRAAANAISFADLANMMENFLPTGRGVWLITQSALSDIIQMSGPTGNASYIWQPNARDGIPGSLLGFPVIWTEKCPRIGTAGDVILADWRFYLIGDRQATTIESTEYDQWAYDQTSWRAVHRVDGQPWLSAPLTYYDGTTQVSPFVILGDTS